MEPIFQNPNPFLSAATSPSMSRHSLQRYLYHTKLYIYTATASVAQRWELAAPFPFLNLSQKTLYEHLFLYLPQLQLYSG